MADPAPAAPDMRITLLTAVCVLFDQIPHSAGSASLRGMVDGVERLASLADWVEGVVHADDADDGLSDEDRARIERELDEAPAKLEKLIERKVMARVYELEEEERRAENGTAGTSTRTDTSWTR
jgi:hypothetical protein